MYSLGCSSSASSSSSEPKSWSSAHIASSMSSCPVWNESATEPLSFERRDPERWLPRREPFRALRRGPPAPPRPAPAAARSGCACFSSSRRAASWRSVAATVAESSSEARQHYLSDSSEVTLWRGLLVSLPRFVNGSSSPPMNAADKKEEGAERVRRDRCQRGSGQQGVAVGDVPAMRSPTRGPPEGLAARGLRSRRGAVRAASACCSPAVISGSSPGSQYSSRVGWSQQDAGVRDAGYIYAWCGSGARLYGAAAGVVYRAGAAAHGQAAPRLARPRQANCAGHVVDVAAAWLVYACMPLQ